MTTLSREIAKALPSGQVTLTGGLVTDVDSSGVVTVNVGGVDLAATLLLGYPVRMGDNVVVAQQNGLAWVLAPAGGFLPTTGTVNSVPVSSSILLVDTAIGTLGLPFLASYASPTAGDSVYLLWAGTQAFVVGKQGATGTPAPTTPADAPTGPTGPPSAPSEGIRSFAPIASGTYVAGWNPTGTDDVAQGTDTGGGTNLGAWFYGGQIHPTLSGVTVTRCQIWLSRTYAGSATSANVYRITNDTRPTGAATYSGSATAVSISQGQAGWFDLPTSLGQALVNSGGSLGIQTGSYLRIAGKTADGSSGALRISYAK